MKQYQDMIRLLINKYDATKELTNNRTGVKTVSVFGYMTRFNLQEGFPLVTLKETFFGPCVGELLAFLKGATNNEEFKELGCNFWTPWATETSEPVQVNGRTSEIPAGTLGPIYGAQWRQWELPYGGSIDQIAELVENLKKRPFSRRHIVSAWNPTLLPDETLSPQENAKKGLMCLAPCHYAMQFNVESQGEGKPHKLSCMLLQRSADSPLGIPYNIASYALLTHMLAQVCDYDVGELVYSIGNLHIYENQIELMRPVLTRQPYPLPHLYINKSVTNIDDFKPSDFAIVNYKYHPFIKLPVAV